jgi:hypothetical protein
VAGLFIFVLVVGVFYGWFGGGNSGVYGFID